MSRSWPLTLGVFAGAVLLPLVSGGEYQQQVLVFAAIFAILAVSLNLGLGWLGELALGQSAFFGLGAYASALLTMRLNVPVVAGFVAAVVVAVVFGLAVGAIALRARGPYFAILSLALGQILMVLCTNLVDFTRGPLGLTGVPPLTIPLPFLDSIDFRKELPYYYVAVLLLALSNWVVWRFLHSATGRAMMAIRENERLATAVGINVYAYKLAVLALSAGIAGLAGAAYIHFVRLAMPDLMGLYYLFNALVMVMVGGQATFVGPILGALLFTAVPELLRVAAGERLLIFGILLLLSVLFFPQGFWPGLCDLWRGLRLGLADRRRCRQPRPSISERA